ncbi:MAG: tetratricopeptide repeat protein [Dehalococcoidia bacterium]
MSQERRPVTILFADVQGFTALSEQRDPEQVAEIMNACLSQLAELVGEHGGHIDKYIGDEIMALFGAPTAHEDDPVRAVRTALAMLRSMDEMATRWELEVGRRLNIRIGINSGIVVAGDIGADGTQQYTVLGDAVNVASRLETAAPVGTILVGEPTYRQAAWAFRWRGPQTLQVKGRDEPVSAYEALEDVPGAAAPRGLSALPTPFLGRQQEMARLRSAWDAVPSGVQAVSIVGEAGLGKSRLIAEFELSLAAGGQAIRFARGVTPPVGNQPYGPVIAALSALARSRDGAHDALPGDLLEVLASEQALAPKDKESLYRAVAACLAAEAANGPFVVVLEDLHWADSATLDLVEALPVRLHDAPVLLILAYRPWRERVLVKDRRHAVIDLQPLPEEDTERLTDLLLGSPHVPAHLRQAVVRQAEGNPFFLEEVVRGLVDQGVLVYRDDQWFCETTPEELDVPDTLRAVILARLDQLDDGLRRLARQASVLGRAFPAAVLQGLAGTPDRIDEPLGRLVSAGVLQPSESSADGRVFAFRHALIREVAYDTLLQRERTALHLQAAQTLERLYPNRLDRFAEVLAYHYEQAGDQPRAAQYYLRASERAEQVHAEREARHFRDAAGRLLGMTSVWSLYAGSERLPRSMRFAAWALQLVIAIAFCVPVLALFASQQPPPSQVTLGLPLGIMSFSPSVMTLAVVIGALPILLTGLGLNQVVVPALLRGRLTWRDYAFFVLIAWLSSLGAVALALAVLSLGLRLELLNETLEHFVGAADFALLGGDVRLIATLLLGTLAPAAAWVAWLRLEAGRLRRDLTARPAPEEGGQTTIVLALARSMAIACLLSLVLLLLYVLDGLPGTDRQPDPDTALFATAAVAFALVGAAAAFVFIRARRGEGAGAGTLGLELPLVTSLMFGVVLAFTLRQGVVTLANGLFGPGEIAVYDRMATLFPDLATAHYLKGERLWFQAPAVIENGELLPADPAQLERAKQAFDRAIEADPSFAPPYLGRGFIRHNQGDLEGALEDAERLIALKPEHPAGYALRALVYQDQGRLDLAATDFERLSEPLPESTQAWDAYFVRCVAFRAAELLDQATADCERSLELNNLHASTFDVLGELYYRSGRYDDALAAYDRFASLAPRDIGTFTNRATVLAALGAYEDALTALNQAVQVSPDYADAYSQRAMAWLYLDDREQAREDAERATELAPNSNSYTYRAAVAIYTGQYEDALAAVDELERAGGDEALVRNLRGYTLALDGDAEGAISELDRAVALAPEWASAYDSRSYARYVAGDHQGALADASRALELVEPYNRASRSEMLYHRALARAALGDTEGAESDAREAQTLRPVPVIERGIEQVLTELSAQ